MSGSLAAVNPEAAAIARRRALADRLMTQATQQDFRHPLSIGATVAQSLAGALTGWRADQDEEARAGRDRAESQAFLGRLTGLLGGGSAAGATPAAPVGGAPAGGAPMAPRPAGASGIRTGAAIPVPTELDDADILARTLIGEAGNQGEEGMRAVAHTVRNRSQRTGAGVRDVVLAPYQYEPWGARRDELLRIPTTDPRYTTARDIALAALGGQSPDPTGGATHFLNPDLQRQLGRQQPSWAPEGQGQRIGAHVFYNPGGGVRVGQGGSAPVAQAQPASAPAPQGDNAAVMRALMLEAATSNNPAIARLAPVIGQMATRDNSVRTAPRGSAIIDSQGRVIGQVPDAPQQPSETERLIPRWRELTALGEQASPAQVQERDMLARRIGGAGVTVNNNNTPEGAFGRELSQRGAARIDTLYPQAQTAAEAIRTTQRIQSLLDSGVITGTGAGAREAIERAFATAGLVDGQRVANTGQLMSELANATLAAAGGLSGPTSDRDIMFLREVAGGNVALTRDTIRRIVQVAGDRSTRTLGEYNRAAESIAGDNAVAPGVRTLYRPIPVPTVDAAPAAPGQQQQQGAVPAPANMQEMQALPPGTVYRAPDGSLRRRGQ